MPPAVDASAGWCPRVSAAWWNAPGSGLWPSWTLCGTSCSGTACGQHWQATPPSCGKPTANLLWLHFTGTSDCHLYGPGSTEAVDASLGADLRRSTGRYLEDPQPRQLAARLNETSPQFRELWLRHEIAEHCPTITRVVHSEVGTLALDCDILTTQRHDPRSW
ncbi:hypothetical protein [Streptomyces tendae]|uniref:MmyB family transcriptional regulator n=1 Tax=Streptomyces tendae TaxID=1932 RepID=UPI001F44AB6B|nr:hypothetical protein [Streptomyces tendae]